MAKGQKEATCCAEPPNRRHSHSKCLGGAAGWATMLRRVPVALWHYENGWEVGGGSWGEGQEGGGLTPGSLRQQWEEQQGLPLT